MRIKADQKVSTQRSVQLITSTSDAAGARRGTYQKRLSMIRIRYISALAKSHRSSYRQGGRCEGSDQDRGDPPFSLQGRIPSSMRTLHLGTSLLGDEKGAIDAATRKVAGRVIHDTIPPAVHAGCASAHLKPSGNVEAGPGTSDLRGIGLFTGCAAGDTGAAVVIEVTD